MLRLKRRADDLEELIDQRGISHDDLERSLTDLEIANRWMGGRMTLLRHLLPKIEKVNSVLDVGCGPADMLRAIADESRRRDLKISLTGVDINPEVLVSARSRCKGYAEMSFIEASAASLPFADESFDVVISSLLLHHLSQAEAVKALSEMARVARTRVIIADLVRSPVAFTSVLLVGKLVFGKLSRYDGPVSIRRAYKPKELVEMARRAGLLNGRVYAGPVRMVLVYDKEGF
ncbi:MAG: methyltransferase domain-containing protein [Armatimonadota bacterium]